MYRVEHNLLKRLKVMRAVYFKIEEGPLNLCYVKTFFVGIEYCSSQHMADINFLLQSSVASGANPHKNGDVTNPEKKID